MILVLDFDGVLNSYTSGWQGAGVINDPPVPGALEFCREAVKAFDVVVVSARCGQPGGSAAIEGWLRRHDFPPGMHVSRDGVKPPAWATIDDRVITFNGTWLSIESLKAFQPWYRRPAPAPAPDLAAMANEIIGMVWNVALDPSSEKTDAMKRGVEARLREIAGTKLRVGLDPEVIAMIDEANAEHEAWKASREIAGRS